MGPSYRAQRAQATWTHFLESRPWSPSPYPRFTPAINFPLGQALSKEPGGEVSVLSIITLLSLGEHMSRTP